MYFSAVYRLRGYRRAFLP